MFGRFVFAAAASAALCLAAPAVAQDRMVLRFSTAASATDVRFPAFEIFAEAIRDFAVFEPHFGATLFAQGTELQALQRGNLELAMPNPQEIAAQVPEWSVFTAGYLIRDPDHLAAVFAADVGREMIALAESRLGIKVLGVMYSGTRQLNLRIDREVRTPADLAGVTLRMPGSEAWQFLGRALGANPTPLAFAEVYTALQTGAIDGQDNALPITRDAKFHEVTRQIVLTGHFVGLDVLSMSLRAWTALTPEQQAIVAAAGAATVADIGARVRAVEGDAAEFFRAAGLRVYTPDVEAFRSRVQAAYLASDYARAWPPGIVERINAVR